jgi:hypothetical protein
MDEIKLIIVLVLLARILKLQTRTPWASGILCHSAWQRAQACSGAWQRAGSRSPASRSSARIRGT